MSQIHQKTYRYIYGPVPSWRLGSSLGVDPISMDDKICSFDCTYCQIGRTKVLTDRRSAFVETNKIIDEIKSLPETEIDFITMSGRGEPTLAKNLGEIIREIRRIRKEKIAVITNSSMLHLEEVSNDLLLADRVVAKLDAPSQDILEKINRPIATIPFEKILSSLKAFRKIYHGELDLQIMFVEPNKNLADDLKKISAEIKPDQIQLNTPLRKCGVTALTANEMERIEKVFEGFKTVSVYRAPKKKTISLSDSDTLKRRGKS